MADTKISAMTAATALAGSEILPIVQGGANKRVAASLINAGALIYLDADYTLTSTTSAQQLFNSPTNGRLTISETGLYELAGGLWISGMSATSGNAVISLIGAGTATLAGQFVHAIGYDASAPGFAGSMTGNFVVGSSAFAVNTVGASTGTSMIATMNGVFKVTAAGTIIPSIALVTAAAAVVEAGSWFRIRKIADAGVVSVGAWD